VKRKFCLMQVRNINYLLIFFTLIFFSCSSKNSSNEILVKIYVESLIIDETYFKDQNLAEQKKKELFSKYNISQNEFKQRLIDLSKNREEWEKFFKQANLLLNDLKKSGAIN